MAVCMYKGYFPNPSLITICKGHFLFSYCHGFDGYQIILYRSINDNVGTLDFIRGLGRKLMEKQAITNRFSSSGNDMNPLCNKGLLKGPMEVLRNMDQRGILADPTVYALLLQECANTKALSEDKQVHFHMIKTGCEPNVFVGSNLVNMCAKYGNVEDVRHVFDKMLERSVVSWNAMIVGYIQNGDGEEALKLFRKMKKADVGKPNTCSPVFSVHTLAKENLELGEQVHASVIKAESELDIFVTSALVDMYAKCSSLDYAHKVFDRMDK